MSFREELERMQRGELSAEEQERLLAEVEKQEAINEYLALRFDQEFPPPEAEVSVALKNESRRINRRIHLRLMGYALLSVAVIAASLALGIWYCDQAFYNPNEGIAQTYGGDGQFMADLAAFTELHSPGYVVSAADATRDGPGSYSLRIRQNDLFTGRELTTTERLVRGQLLGAGDSDVRDYWRFPVANAFGYRRGIIIWVDENGVEHRTPDPEQLAIQKEALAELPSSSQAAVFVTFSKDLTLSEYAKFWRKSQLAQLYPAYAAVVTEDDYLSDLLGFEPCGTGVLMKNPPDQEKYPYFELGGNMDALQNDPAPVWESHFRSLLSYLSEREEFLESMAAVNGISPWTYREALSYIDQNGIKVYGTLIHGGAQQILQLLEQDIVSDFYISDVRLSILSH